jgi:hypothetical protein
MKCECSVPNIKSEEFDPSDLDEKPVSDPSIKRFKRVLKILTQVSKTASKSSEGKSLPDAYWDDFGTFLKRAKLGMSQLELGIDDEETMDKSSDGKIQVTPDEGGKAREEMIAARELALKAQQDALKAQQDALAAKTEKDKVSDTSTDKPPPPTGDNKAPDKKTPPSPPKKGDSEDKETEDDKKKVKESVDIEERSVSKAQQRFMAMVKGVQSGKSKATGKAATAAKEMSKKDVDVFASTPHADLPDRAPPKNKKKKAHESVKLISKLVRVGYSYHNASVDAGTVLLEFMKDGIPVQFTINENVEYEEFGYSCILGKVGDDNLLESLNDFLTKEKLCILMEDDAKNV